MGDTDLIQHRPAFLKRSPVQHAFHTRTQTVDLDELDHQPISGVEFCQLFRRSFTVNIEFADLTVIVRRGEFDGRGCILVQDWEGLA